MLNDGEQNAILGECSIHRLMLALDSDAIQFKSYMKLLTGSIDFERPMESKGDFDFINDMNMAFKPAASCSSSLLLHEYGIPYRFEVIFMKNCDMIPGHSPTRTLGRFSARPGMVKLKLVSCQKYNKTSTKSAYWLRCHRATSIGGTPASSAFRWWILP